MNFRQDFMRSRNLKLRLLDFCCHILAGCLIVAAFDVSRFLILAQWLPDFYVIYIWSYSMLTKKWLAEDSVYLRLHRLLHKPEFSVTVLMFFVVMFSLTYAFGLADKETTLIKLEVVGFLACNFATHLSIDHFTHEEVR